MNSIFAQLYLHRPKKKKQVRDLGYQLQIDVIMILISLSSCGKHKLNGIQMKYIKKTAVHFWALIRIMTDLRNNVYIGSKKYKSYELQRASLTLSGPGANISQYLKGKRKLK